MPQGRSLTVYISDKEDSGFYFETSKDQNYNMCIWQSKLIFFSLLRVVLSQLGTFQEKMLMEQRLWFAYSIFYCMYVMQHVTQTSLFSLGPPGVPRSWS